MFSGIWAKIAGVGGAILVGLLIIWRIFKTGESAGEAKQEVKQQREAKKAKAKMDAVKQPETQDETWARGDRGEL